METDSAATIPNVTTPKQLSHWVSIGAVLAALALGLVVLYHSDHSPRTDDAEVFANFIGIAPQVEGPIMRLNVRDNQFVKKGTCCTKSMNGRINTRWREPFPSRRRSKGKSPTSERKNRGAGERGFRFASEHSQPRKPT